MFCVQVVVDGAELRWKLDRSSGNKPSRRGFAVLVCFVVISRARSFEARSGQSWEEVVESGKSCSHLWIPRNPRTWVKVAALERLPREADPTYVSRFMCYRRLEVKVPGLGHSVGCKTQIRSRKPQAFTTHLPCFRFHRAPHSSASLVLRPNNEQTRRKQRRHSQEHERRSKAKQEKTNKKQQK